MIRSILHYPDLRLRNPGKHVVDFGPAFQKLVDDMAETMYAAPGVGLAATQIGEPFQLFIVDCAQEGEPSDFRVFTNPVIVETEGEIRFTEGCLSFPGATEEIVRFRKVKVKAQDRHGLPFELEAEGLLAVAIQHEKDHLDGRLMIDKLSPLKKRMLHKKMQKQAAER